MAWLARGGFATSVSGGRDMDSLTGICSQMVASVPVIGMVEVKGTAEALRPLVSHLAEQPCVYYSWSVAEHWSRTVTETYRDSDGKTKTRTRHESGWTTVADGGEQSPFYLKDDVGMVQVQPEGAKIEPVTIFSESCGRGDPLYYAKGPAGAVAHSDHRRQFTETAIPIHTPLYVMGQAREARKDIVAPEIAWDPDCPMFLISSRDEEQISLGFASWILGRGDRGAGVGGWRGGHWQSRRGGSLNMATSLSLLAAALGLLGWPGLWAGFGSSSTVSSACETACVRRGPWWTCN